MNDRGAHAPHSLSTKLPLAFLASMLAALAVYLLASGVGTVFVNRFYMSTDAVANRKAEIYTELNRYVIANQLSGSDTEGLERFLQMKNYISVTVFPAEELGIGMDNREQARDVRMQSLDPPKRFGITGKLYPMRFSDGFYYVSITDNSRLREDAINRAIAMVFAGVMLVMTLLWYTNRLTQRIIELSQQAANIGAGDLDGPITVDGRDEISALAEDIDGMRDAIIERMGNEKRAWEANSELITAMSHDIRTPMTALIGYLDLLKSGEALPDEDRHHYLDAAYGKSLALKELTDELFKYFLVFGSSEPEIHAEDYDAHMLLMQLLGEAEFDLQDFGMEVRSTDLLTDSCMVHTDPSMLKRVIDNLISNIKKYADPKEPVEIRTEMKNGDVTVTVSNTVGDVSSRTESTKIGLRTCIKIMDSLGGAFRTERDERRFAAEFSLKTLPSDKRVS